MKSYDYHLIGDILVLHKTEDSDRLEMPENTLSFSCLVMSGFSEIDYDFSQIFLKHSSFELLIFVNLRLTLLSLLISFKK